MEDKRELTKADKANLARISKLSKTDKDKLTDWEKEFTKNQGARFEKFKDKVFLSEKQSSALAKIVAALDKPDDSDLPDPDE
ncbi:MAG: hypothetical protein KGJ74_07615 [Betaproteobacteria bacterium]|nr:hypothetical protein [Betaproteobacteria bacterium]